MSATHDAANPIPPEKRQHMLLFFLPLRNGALTQLAEVRDDSGSTPPDLRASTGVHFAMFHYVPEGAPSFLPVPTFQSAPGKDLLVALSLYDADFVPYISAFTSEPSIAKQLDDLLMVMDETGIVADDDPTSAVSILRKGGAAQNNEQFIELLMRYNFGDPTLSSGSGSSGGVLDLIPEAGRRYAFHAVFPGLTVGDVIANYPNASKLWPWPPVAADATAELAAR